MPETDDDSVETTELRWFADGSLPDDVISWFTQSGTVGAVELRTDTYRVGGRPDLGVKRRSGLTLELKRRLRIDEELALGTGLAGRTETWRKWSPATSSELNGHDPPWVAVRKHIVKRLFSDDGEERRFSYDARAGMAAGCDVELADVSVGGVRAWTFAFAAFGPAPTRRRAILTCWHALNAGGPVPEDLGARCTTEANYPVWLDLLVEPVHPPDGLPNS